MKLSAKHFYEFGPFRLDVDEGLLGRNEEIVPLRPKPFAILMMLVKNCGHVVEKDELIRAVWPDSIVEECNLARNVSTLRRTLGDCEGSHQYIETVPRRGYRFAIKVKEWREETPAPIAPLSLGERGVGNPAARSLAVLPFKLLNADGSYTCMGLGMADALITRLSNFRQLNVRPTSAMRRFAGQEADSMSAGSELGVSLILEGTVQQSGERVRTTAQLVSVRDRTTMWGEQFDASFTDVFTIEDSIAGKIACALLSHLTAQVETEVEFPSLSPTDVRLDQ